MIKSPMRQDSFTIQCLRGGFDASCVTLLRGIYRTPHMMGGSKARRMLVVQDGDCGGEVLDGEIND
jgi:hypothetical protein